MRLGSVEALTVIIGTIVGTGLAVGEWLRRVLRRREARVAERFRRSVQQIVDASAVDLIARQASFEQRVQRHLEAQDRAIARLPGVIRNGNLPGPVDTHPPGGLLCIYNVNRPGRRTQ